MSNIIQQSQLKENYTLNLDVFDVLQNYIPPLIIDPNKLKLNLNYDLTGKNAVLVIEFDPLLGLAELYKARKYIKRFDLTILDPTTGECEYDFKGYDIYKAGVYKAHVEIMDDTSLIETNKFYIRFNFLSGYPTKEVLDALNKKIGSGGGGTSDYNDLNNKPQVNGTTLGGSRDGHFYGLVNQMDIVDNLTTDRADQVLSANQGFVLNNLYRSLKDAVMAIKCLKTGAPMTGEVGDIVVVNRSDVAGLTALPLAYQLLIWDANGVVAVYDGSSSIDTIQVNIISKRTDIVDNLTTQDATKALSAKQGYLLKGSLQAVANDVSWLSNVINQAHFLKVSTQLSTAIFGETEIPYADIIDTYNPTYFTYRFTMFLDPYGTIAMFNGGTSLNSAFADTIVIRP